ncbi:MAG: FliH/SctL family protein [Candidatus Cloacimonetes bacterium]|nr:FliH/SctL family protein [Candidatus Cloacimonadota bacterium]
MKEIKINPGHLVKNASLVEFKSVPSDIPVMTNNYQILIDKAVAENTKRLQDDFTVKLEAERKKYFMDGIEQGKQKTQELMQLQLKSAMQVLTNINNSYKNDMDKIYEKEEQNMLCLIFEIAQKIVGIETKINNDVVLQILKKCLKVLGDRRSIKILVNPRDWRTVKDSLSSLKVKTDLPDEIEVVATEDISAGGCKIENESGSIDGTIETQFEEIRRKLLKTQSAD